MRANFDPHVDGLLRNTLHRYSDVNLSQRLEPNNSCWIHILSRHC